MDIFTIELTTRIIQMTIIELFGRVVKPKLIKGKGMFSPIETGRVNENILCIRDKDVNMFFYIKEECIFAIDCGYKNSNNIEAGIKTLGIKGSDVKAIFLTHVDLDHAGGVDKRCINLFPNAKVFLSCEEEKYILNKYSRKKLIFYNLKTPIKLRDEYETLKNMQIIDMGKAKIQAIFTPGHTLGHTSYMVDNKYLFVGDSIILNSSGGYCFYDFWNIDSELNIQSLRNLKVIAEEKKCKLILTSHSKYTDDLSLAFANIDTKPSWKPKGYKFIDNAPDDLFS